MNYTQMIFLALIALSGIPVGMLLRKKTKEEMKPGRRWFKMIAVACISIILGLIITGEINPVYLTVLAFIFFISIVPLKK